MVEYLKYEHIRPRIKRETHVSTDFMTAEFKLIINTCL